MKKSNVIFACVIVLTTAAVACASGGGAEAAHGGEHGLPWGNFLARSINFIIFAALIWKFAGAKAVAFFKGRKSDIKQNLDDLQVRQAEAEKKLKQVETSIANLEQERQSILAEAEQQGEAMKEAIIAKAKEDAARMSEQAKRSIENDAKAAMEQMKAQMAELVVEAAAKNIQEKLTDKDHESLVDEYLTKVVLN